MESVYIIIFDLFKRNLVYSVTTFGQNKSFMLKLESIY